MVIGARHEAKAVKLINVLKAQTTSNNVSFVRCDIQSSASIRLAITSTNCQLVINTCGPFQYNDYRCAQTAITAGVDYIDLADGREYVCGFRTLDALARRHGVIAVTGASSVPALSSAIVDELAKEYKQLVTIDSGINPGNQTPRGIATVRSILSYCGKPFLVWHENRWKNTFGWQGLRRRRYPKPMGARWLSDCNIPDLTLFQQRYPDARTIRFKAGLELSVLHLGTWLLSFLVRSGLLAGLDRIAPVLKSLSERVYRLGSSTGGMHVAIDGMTRSGEARRSTWYLIASDGDGPEVPCTAAVILAQKLMHKQIVTNGAVACMGLIDKDEFDREFARYRIRQVIQHTPIQSTHDNRWRERAALYTGR